MLFLSLKVRSILTTLVLLPSLFFIIETTVKCKKMCKNISVVLTSSDGKDVSISEGSKAQSVVQVTVNTQGQLRFVF